MQRHGLNVARFILYILGKCLAVGLAVLAVVLAFHTAVNSSNVYMVAKDAFAKRTSVILMPVDNSDTELLPKIYTEGYLAKSGLADDMSNADYKISNYVERTDVSVAVVWPWYKKVQIEATNIVDSISASISDTADMSDFKQVESFISSGKYRVTLVKTEIKNDDGSAQERWMVDDIELLEEVTPDHVEPVPTPAPKAEESVDEGFVDETVDEPAVDEEGLTDEEGTGDETDTAGE
ncbi:MAG: hypothetical protein DBX46_01815 [Clostridiales bacterium]|nr:MAG: hypothetical protein DBX46_01815 [Clostridiales bacterium]